MADFVDPIITQEIVDAKDKLVVEANRAEVIVDEWYATGNLVKDAPSDGKIYGRKDALWEEVVGGASVWGGITGNLADQTDLQNELNTKLTTDTSELKIDYLDSIDTIKWGINGSSQPNVGIGKASATEVGLMARADWSKLDAIEVNAQVNKFDYTDAPVDTKQYARQDGAWAEVVGGGGASTWGSITGNLSDQTDLQNELNSKQGQSTILDNTTASYTTTEETKLSGIEVGAQVNVGEEFTTAEQVKLSNTNENAEVATVVAGTGVTVDNTDPQNPVISTSGTVGSTWGTITGNLADQTDLQLALDAKIDGVDLSATKTATQVTINNTEGNNAIIPSATITDAGVLIATDKVKLDSVETGAQVNVGEEYTLAEQTKLSGIETGAQVNVGEEYTTAEQSKLAGIEAGAEVNVVGEAPSDGTPYARQDAGWVSAGGGGVQTSYDSVAGKAFLNDGSVMSAINEYSFLKYALVDQASMSAFFTNTFGANSSVGRVTLSVKAIQISSLTNLPAGWKHSDGTRIEVMRCVLSSYEEFYITIEQRAYSNPSTYEKWSRWMRTGSSPLDNGWYQDI